jgi:hypothetical protein
MNSFRNSFTNLNKTHESQDKVRVYRNLNRSDLIETEQSRIQKHKHKVLSKFLTHDEIASLHQMPKKPQKYGFSRTSKNLVSHKI